MFGYIDNVNDKAWKLCSKEKFYEIIDSEAVARQVAVVRSTGKKSEKGKLPCFIFGGELLTDDYQRYVEDCQQKGITKLKGSRSSQFLKPTGLFMMDFDRDTDVAKQLFDKFLGAMEANQINTQGFLGAAHRTPGGNGLRLVLRRRPGKSIWDDQLWVAQLMQEAIDEKCKDISRTSFAVARGDFFYIDEEVLFPIDDSQLTMDNYHTDIADVKGSRENTPKALPLSKGEYPEGGREYVVPKENKPQQEEDYDGIPYPLLVTALEEQLGGVPVHGSRNHFIFSMACHLRYVCNDSPDWIKAVLPTYGEDTTKAHRTIESACNRAQSRFMPQIVKRAIDVARNRARTKTALSLAGGMGDLPPAMPADEELPPLIRLLTSKVPDIYKPSVSSAVFPPLGTHLGKVYFRYIDNVLHQSTFMNVLLAKMSVGKNCVNAPIDCILADIQQRDDDNRRREREWNDEVSRKGANKEKPKRPNDLCIQLLVNDMTNAAFVRRLEEANGQFIYTRLDEVELLDQLKTGSKGQQVSQIIRLAFDCGWYGQERVGSQSVTARVQVKWNWNASSTIQNGQRYFRNSLADGTLSRLSFCTIIAERGAKIPVIGNYDEAFKEELKPYIDNLNAAEGIIACPEAEALAKQLLEENADVANLSDDEVYETLSYRANVIAYLKAMTLYVAQGCQWDERIEHFIRWSEQYDLWCKMKFFGERMQEQMGKEQVDTKKGPQNLLDLLPSRFTMQDAIGVRRQSGKDDKANEMLRSWIKRSYIFKDVTGEFVKTENYMKRHSQITPSAQTGAVGAVGQ